MCAKKFPMFPQLLKQLLIKFIDTIFLTYYYHIKSANHMFVNAKAVAYDSFNAVSLYGLGYIFFAYYNA